eukprot:11329547-Heterocapsa_arctica.AAC.1
MQWLAACKQDDVAHEREGERQQVMMTCRPILERSCCMPACATECCAMQLQGLTIITTSPGADEDTEAPRHCVAKASKTLCTR